MALRRYAVILPSIDARVSKGCAGECHISGFAASLVRSIPEGGQLCVEQIFGAQKSL